jgi:hypothetical protein
LFTVLQNIQSLKKPTDGNIQRRYLYPMSFWSLTENRTNPTCILLLKQSLAERQWLTPVILATQEAEIRKIAV